MPASSKNQSTSFLDLLSASIPNTEQVKGAVTTFLSAAVPVIAFLVTYGVPQNIAAIVSVVLGVLCLMAYVIWDNTHKRTIAAAAAIPGVKAIDIAKNASDGAAAAAADTDIKNVNKV